MAELFEAVNNSDFDSTSEQKNILFVNMQSKIYRIVFFFFFLSHELSLLVHYEIVFA